MFGVVVVIRGFEAMGEKLWLTLTILQLLKNDKFKKLFIIIIGQPMMKV